MILVSALYNPEEPLFAKSFISSAVTVSLCSLHLPPRRPKPRSRAYRAASPT
jgi:hypothetical protein